MNGRPPVSVSKGHKLSGNPADFTPHSIQHESDVGTKYHQRTKRLIHLGYRDTKRTNLLGKISTSSTGSLHRNRRITKHSRKGCELLRHKRRNTAV